MADLKCQKCFRPLVQCQACNGTGGKGQGFFGDLSCSKCGSTGLVCPEHGAYWQKDTAR